MTDQNITEQEEYRKTGFLPGISEIVVITLKVFWIRQCEMADVKESRLYLLTYIPLVAIV